MRTVCVDPTLINLIQSCHYKWFLSYVKVLQIAGAPPDYIEAGDLLHVMLKWYYRLWQEPLSIRIDAGVFYGRKRAHKLYLPGEDVDNTIGIFREYAKFYAGEPAIPLAIEEPFSRVIWESEEDQLRIILEGIVDLVMDFRGHKQVWDHKSSERRPNPQPMVNQFPAYCLAFGLDTAVINAVNMTPLLTPKKKEPSSIKPEDRFRRVQFSYSRGVLERWRMNVVRTIKDLLFSIETGEFPQNLTACNKFNHPCIFQSLCMTEPELRAWKAARDYIVGERWDPMKRDADDEGEVFDVKTIQSDTQGA